jgi:hypothetical protein
MANEFIARNGVISKGNVVVTGSLTTSGSLTTTGTITATTLVVQTITSSISSITGSTNFGSLSSNTHKFTGSLLVTGSIGIGTTASIAGSALNVQGSQGAMILNNPTANDYSGFRIYNDQSSANRALEIDYAGSTYSSALISGGITGESAAIVTTGAYPIQFGTTNTFRMAILANGKVGIGTTSPTLALTVQADSTDMIAWRSPTYVAGQLGLDTNNAHGAIFLFSSGSQNTQITAKPGAYTYFNAGNVGIGTSSPQVKLEVNGNTIISGSSGGGGLIVQGVGNSSTGLSAVTIRNGGYGTDYNTILGVAAGSVGYLQLGNNGNNEIVGGSTGAGGYLRFWVNNSNYGPSTPNGTLAMTINSAGSIGAPSGTNIYNASDVRLKQNVVTITNGLNKILGLNPVKFNWIDGFEPSEDGKDLLGFIAQEVQETIPEAIEHFGGNSVTVGETVIENPLRVNEKFIIPVLVKAIQELTVRVQELENK